MSEHKFPKWLPSSFTGVTTQTLADSSGLLQFLSRYDRSTLCAFLVMAELLTDSSLPSTELLTRLVE